MVIPIWNVPTYILRALPSYADRLKEDSAFSHLDNNVKELDRRIAKCVGHIHHIQDRLPQKVTAKASRFTAQSKHRQIDIAKERLGILQEARTIFALKRDTQAQFLLNGFAQLLSKSYGPNETRSQEVYLGLVTEEGRKCADLGHGTDNAVDVNQSEEHFMESLEKAFSKDQTPALLLKVSYVLSKDPRNIFRYLELIYRLCLAKGFWL